MLYLDSYGMTNFTVNVMLKFEVELLRPDLSGNPFYAAQRSEKIDFVEPKGLGAEDGLRCPKSNI